ncbi:inositol monophosphatase family protein [Asticcacaulis machinosus]|uniref:Myo-inositol-1(Or 4)-monophosphatase n=1 Tax=Asticcacaulis machinosus TaxID=2984211 RepID=A0ABT5HJL6_9CAUL|nr:inositol monophosphatase family protein [Asticcacaulis machinosus]MDC7676445.1 hypothetical protein [Asticcacaulis machinosus]
MTDAIKILGSVAGVVQQHLPHVLANRREVTWKDDGSPVTVADVFLENAIKDHLTGLMGDINFVGEESYTIGAADDQDWTAVLDPIDGTENFCSGLPEWGVSLSIWHKRQHAASMLMVPEMGLKLMTGDKIDYQTSRITGFSSSINDKLVEMIPVGGEARIMGCAVYNLFNVVRGSLARFVNPAGAKSWDMLAGVQLAREHGCEVIVEGEPYDGRYLEPDRKHRFDIRHRHDLHPR